MLPLAKKNRWTRPVVAAASLTLVTAAVGVNTAGAEPTKITSVIAVGQAPNGIAVTPNGKMAYVANEASGTLSMIRTKDNASIGQEISGKQPFGVAAHPDGKRIYVSNFGDQTVSVFRTSDNTVRSTIPNVGLQPRGLVTSTNGDYLYVANRGDGSGTGSVTVIDTVSHQIIDRIAVGTGPQQVASAANGKRIYVTNVNRGAATGSITVIRAKDNTVVDTIAVGREPVGIAVAPDSKRAYVTNVGDGTVTVISTEDDTIVDTLVLSDGPQPLLQPFGVAITSNGKFAYVCGLATGTTKIIRTKDNTVVATIPNPGSQARGIAISPDDARVFVTDREQGKVTLIAATAPSQIRKLRVSPATNNQNKFPWLSASWWKSASNGGAAITNYQYRIKKKGRAWQDWQGKKKTKLQVSGTKKFSHTWKRLRSGKPLKSGAKYLVQIRAKNPVETGKAKKQGGRLPD